MERFLNRNIIQTKHVARYCLWIRAKNTSADVVSPCLEIELAQGDFIRGYNAIVVKVYKKRKIANVKFEPPIIDCFCESHLNIVIAAFGYIKWYAYRVSWLAVYPP